MSDRIANPGGLPLSAGQVNAIIEGVVQREKRLHPLRPFRLGELPRGAEPMAPRGLVRSMVRLVQRMRDDWSVGG